MCIAYLKPGGGLACPLALVCLLAMPVSALGEPSGLPGRGAIYGFSNYENDDWVPLQGRSTIDHCSGYGCRHRQLFTFTDRDLLELALIMSETVVADTAKAERIAIRKAIAWMENRVGRALGTNRDQTSIGFLAAGRKDQHDCVDEARNSAAYLAVLHANGLIRHHGRPHIVNRGSLMSMPHYGVVMREKGGRRLWALDSGVGGNGAPPRIETAERWFARGGSSVPRRRFE